VLPSLFTAPDPAGPPSRQFEPLKHPVLCYGTAYAVLLAVAVVSLMPAPSMGGSDKLYHFFSYAGLSFGFVLLVRTIPQLALAAIGLTAYGVLLELLQGLTGYRQMEALDMLANGLGVLAAVPLWWSPLPRWFRIVERGFD
jgi:hypothetical protein